MTVLSTTLLCIAFAPWALAQESDRTDSVAWDGPLPSVAVDWRRERVEISIQAPAGEHIAGDAPARIAIGTEAFRLELDGTGDRLLQPFRLSLPGEGHWALEGELDLSLCQNSGDRCRWVETRFSTTLAGKRVQERLVTRPRSGGHGDDKPRTTAHLEPEPLALDEAMDRARNDGHPVIIDFGAIWCPPCNQMAAEVFEDAADADFMAGFHLVIVDADRPESWTLKVRYAVGGYPTVVAVDGDGAEIARQVGYFGEQQMLDWLTAVAARRGALDQRLLLARGEDLSPTELGTLALDLARSGREAEAREVIALAPQDKGSHQAALVLSPDPAEVRWLAKNAPDDLLLWMWQASEPAKQDADLRAAMAPAIQQTLAAGDAASVSEVLGFLAEICPDTLQASAFHAAAAGMLRHTLTGDPQLDRGTWSSLAYLLEQSGQLEAAQVVLQDALRHFPREYTYQNALARVFQEQGHPEVALDHARKALSFAYGDMRLRAAMTLASVLRDLDRAEEGVEVLDKALAEQPAPDPTLEVRTHRYRQQVETLRTALLPGPDPAEEPAEAPAEAPAD